MRKLYIVGAVAVSCMLVAALVFSSGAYWASQQTPEFYEQAMEMHPSAQRQASDAMLENATALASNAQKEGRWQARFTDEQINGWLAVDLVENHPQLLPKQVADPRVRFGPQRTMIACRYSLGGIQTVLTLDVQLYMPESNAVAMRIHSVRAGAMPVPMGEVLKAVGIAARRMNVQVRWVQQDGDPVALMELAPARDKDTVYRLEGLELRDGELYLSGRTERLDPHAHGRNLRVLQPAFAQIFSTQKVIFQR